MLRIADSRRTITRQLDGPLVDAILAGISADPENLEDLLEGCRRFMTPSCHSSLFAADTETSLPESNFAVLDLPARLLYCRADRWVLPRGTVSRYDRAATGRALSFHVSDQWYYCPPERDWQAEIAARRRARRRNPPCDARPVLYRRLLDFLYDRCRQAPDKLAADTVVALHAEWLLTPRDDLGGRSPRQLLLADLHHIDFDLQGREDQWSQLGECPPGLSRQSAGYRRGAFGTHENAMYFQLVRRLTQRMLRLVRRFPRERRATAVGRMKRWMQTYLRTPQQALGGYSPHAVIDHERRRIPLVSRLEDPLAPDPESGFGPSFVHFMFLGGDEQHFAFSLFDTEQEWREEQAYWAACGALCRQASPGAVGERE